MIALLLFLGVAVAQTVDVYVFTMNRLASLRRLVDSIQKSEPPSLLINLNICIDKPRTGDNQAVRSFAKTLSWKRGTKTVKEHQENVNVIGQWLNCWDPSVGNKEFVAMLEDDLVVSKHALAWLVKTHAKYKSQPDVIGYSLQRQTNCFHSSCLSPRLDIPWHVVEYKYLLVGTWGYAPVKTAWKKFLDWQRNISATYPDYSPQVANLLPSQWYRDLKSQGRHNTMWEMWFIDYCDRNRLYTVYYNHPTPLTLASNMKEPGEHFSGKAQADFPALDDRFVESKIPPNKVPVLDWVGKYDANSILAKQKEAAMSHFDKINHQASVFMITFINFSYRNMTLHFLCNLQAAAVELLAESTVFMITDAGMYALSGRLEDEWEIATFPFPLLPQSTEMSGNILYGHAGFWQLMLARTAFLLEITNRGLPFFLFECDAFVRENFLLPFIETATADKSEIVAIEEHPDHPNMKEFNGGFFLMTGRPNVRKLWKKVLDEYTASVKKHVGDRFSGAVALPEHEQSIASRLAKHPDNRIRISFMDNTAYMSGKSFTIAALAPYTKEARVVLFNFVVGNGEKIDRAKKHNMWFHDSVTDGCIKQ